MKKCQLCNVEIQKPGSGRPRKYCKPCAAQQQRTRARAAYEKRKSSMVPVLSNAERMQRKRGYLKSHLPLFHLTQRQRATALEAERRKDQRVRARESFLARTRKAWLKTDYTSDSQRNKRHILRAKAYGVAWEKVPIKAMPPPVVEVTLQAIV